MRPDVTYDRDGVEAIAAQLDLRPPNREALESIAVEVERHYAGGGEPPFEGVIDAATGVGKTFIMAGAIEYLATTSTARNFAIIAPGRTILDKTVNNFTVGHPKSILRGMTVTPLVITSSNFASASVRAAMEDPAQVKLYVFTVQALTRPTQSDVGRRTHEFQEGLGKGLYAHLLSLDDLVVFADEHHCYYGRAFSGAIRDLAPYALVGLTATPHAATPEDRIIYRYPLAAAIADKHVKTPVIVGRKDDRSDTLTKLLDGARLLEFKRAAIDRYCAETGKRPVNPVMLVVAETIEEANEYGALLEQAGFEGGRYAGAVLVVHSDQPDAALEALDRVEDPDSPVRIILSVGMLREGWDVKNVYVVASMRASVSDILTEQTLGRGLRLPFGAYTDIEILDTLEVVAHERYEALLRRANALNEAFIDQRTRLVLRRNAQGEAVPVTETTPTHVHVFAPEEPGRANVGGVAVTSIDDRSRVVGESATRMQTVVQASPDFPELRVPRMEMTAIQSRFSLADITNVAAFRRLGERIAADPLAELRRVRLDARIVVGADGLRRTELATSRTVDRIESQGLLLPLANLTEELVLRVLQSPAVEARSGERAAATVLVREFVAGLGSRAQEVLSAFLDRSAGALVGAVQDEQRRVVSRPVYSTVVRIDAFAPSRQGRERGSADRFGAFTKGVAYSGWRKGMHAEAWFDSRPERDLANLLDEADEIVGWVRLLRNDLPILWHGGGNYYNPDFIAVDAVGTRWVLEVKSDRDLPTESVQAKRDAALRWANHVSLDPGVGVAWKYALFSESMLTAARGSWAALRGLSGS